MKFQNGEVNLSWALSTALSGASDAVVGMLQDQLCASAGRVAVLDQRRERLCRKPNQPLDLLDETTLFPAIREVHEDGEGHMRAKGRLGLDRRPVDITFGILESGHSQLLRFKLNMSLSGDSRFNKRDSLPISLAMS